MDYIVETNFQQTPFVAVPNHVAQNKLFSADALGVLVWMASMPRGFLMRRASILEQFGFGKDKWQRIAKELKDAGAMVVEKVRGRDGRIVAHRTLLCWPEPPETPESRKTRPSDQEPENPAAGIQEPGFPAAGKPGPQGRKIRPTRTENPAPYKEEEKYRARAPARERATPTSDKTDRGVKLNDLDPFLINRIENGEPVVVGNEGNRRRLQPGDAEFERLQGEAVSARRAKGVPSDPAANAVH